MKIFSLISFAAILNHLTPVLAASDYDCGPARIPGSRIQNAYDEAHRPKFQANSRTYEPRELFTVGTYEHEHQEDTETIKFIVKVGGTFEREILWVKAFANREWFHCEPATV
ncbi:BgTH12-05022 [Blumeria graminis f. sp. triticale]|uniref:Bgt_avrF2_11 n=2 Tax=Blumeria graminis TaxID=34373 RepID=A0A9X9QD07_BLUGR|nr:BgTH12-05022 [Blumeria graminis f. sp. triticale]VDB87711.1 Bgt_avrF2_11 [Blumeria graminis f. sp. tritici]